MNSPAPNPPAQLTSEQLLAALDSQIEHDSARQRSEGWTRWAVWGTLALLLWKAIGIWTAKDVVLVHAAHLFILAFVIWKFLEEIIWILIPNARLQIGPPRFHLAQDSIHPMRPDFAITALQYLVILGVLFHFGIPRQWCLWVYALSAVAVCLSMFLSGVLMVGTPAFMNLQAAIFVATGIQLVSLGLSGWQIGSLLRVDLAAYTSNELRLALVLNAIAFLLSKLTTATSSEYLLNKLTQLRQHIAFGRITPAEANKLAEEFLTGVTLTQLLNPLVEKISTAEASLQALLTAAHKRLDGAQAELLAPGPGPQQALRILDEIDLKPKAVYRQVKQIRRDWTRLLINAFGIAFYAPATLPEAIKITNEVQAQLRAATQLLKAYSDRFYQMKKQTVQLVLDVQNGIPRELPYSTPRDLNQDKA